MTSDYKRQQRVFGKLEVLLDLLILQARGVERDRKAASKSLKCAIKRARRSRISAESEK